MELVLSPEKNLYIDPTSVGVNDQNFMLTFNSDFVSGLLQLVKSPEIRSRSVSMLYWHEFGAEILKNFCTITVNSDIEVRPDADIIKKYIEVAPEITGREYLDYELLWSFWEKTNKQLYVELMNFSGGFKEFVESHYSDWAQVGRIHFHLAETKNTSTNKPFAFLATYTTRVSDKTRIQHIPLGQAVATYAKKEKQDLLISMLKPIREAALASAFIHDLVEKKQIYQTVFFDNTAAYNFLSSSTACDQAGIVVKLPQSWQSKKPSRAKVSVQIGDSKKKSFVGFNSLFKFRVSVTVDGHVLSQQEIENLLKKDQKLVEIRGKWIEVDKKRLESLLGKWHKASYLQKEGFTFSEAMRMLASSNLTNDGTQTLDSCEQDEKWLEFIASDQIKEVLDSLRSPDSLASKEMDVVLKKQLKTTLRPYQKTGVKWLRLLSHLNLGGCLADDMGLGKTIQIISLLLLEKESKTSVPSLIIVPASLLGNWEDELTKFAPSLSFCILHRSRLSKEEVLAFKDKELKHDIFITTYSFSKRISWLKEQKWNLVVLDEAQAIKTPGSQQTKSVKEIPGRVKISMTGTPIENNTTDIWSLFDFSCPSLLGSCEDFKKLQKKMVEKKSYASLRKLVRPYLLRRKKTDRSIISDLPNKTEVQTYCLLTKEQTKLYKQTIDELAKDLASEEVSNMKRKGLILSYLLKFKQICNHPSQLLNDNIYDFKKSGKFFRLKELTETIAAKGEKVLIFTQFREITDILSRFLSEIFARKGFVLHGSTPIQKRKKLVEEFQKDCSAPYFILSLKAGGTGLNLTKASHVIHFDRWWNPAVENQATDRAYRIGQKNNVMVHKFICRGTLEEKINLMIEDKKTISESVVEGKQEKNITELSNEEVLNLVSLNIKSAEMVE